jgi:hypothetical protein
MKDFEAKRLALTRYRLGLNGRASTHRTLTGVVEEKYTTLGAGGSR